MAEDKTATPQTARPMWAILPGLLIYNLVGRHILGWRMRRTRKRCGKSMEFAPRPGWISLSDIRWAKGEIQNERR